MVLQVLKIVKDSSCKCLIFGRIFQKILFCFGNLLLALFSVGASFYLGLKY